MYLLEAVERYIRAKKVHTDCMQRHFRQLCQNCPGYSSCPVYGEYVNAWIELQEAAKVVTHEGGK